MAQQGSMSLVSGCLASSRDFYNRRCVGHFGQVNCVDSGEGLIASSDLHRYPADRRDSSRTRFNGAIIECRWRQEEERKDPYLFKAFAISLPLSALGTAHDSPAYWEGDEG